MAVSKKANHGKKRQKRSIHQINEVKANKKAKRREKTFKIVLYSLFGITLLIGVAVTSIAIWYQDHFNISFADLLLSTFTSAEIVNDGFIGQMLSSCIIPVLIALIAYVGAAILLWKDTPKRKILRISGAIFCDVLFLGSLIFATVAFRIPEYLNLIL